MPPQEVQLNLSEQCSLEAWADKLQAWGWQWSPAGGSCVRLTHHAEVLGTALGATDFQVRLLLLFSRHEQRTFLCSSQAYAGAAFDLRCTACRTLLMKC